MKDYLKKLIQRKKDAIATLIERSDASDDVKEVRALSTQVDELKDEIRDAETKLAELEQAEAQGGEQRGFNPLGTYGSQITPPAGEENEMAFRQAFMNLVMRNVPIPTELRENANTLTSDVASVIPTTLVGRIIERMEQCGMILSRVTRTSYKGGVAIPTSNVKPVATWTAEGKGSDRQKKTTGTITFTYFKLRCEISMSMEVGEMALALFESKFVENVAKAMVIAIEKAILKGDGETQPQGIIGQEITANRKTISTKVKYSELIEIESKVPVEYEETAVWVMTKAQFGNFLAMVDEQGQPIARVNYGISGKPERSLLGREVILHPYGDVTNGDMLIVDLNDYVLNTIYDMGISKKQDWDTEDLLTKAVMSVDGKLVDNTSVQLITFTV